MNILVTGASGFIGSTLIKRLVKEGYSVKALTHKNKPKSLEKKVALAGDPIFIKALDKVIFDHKLEIYSKSGDPRLHPEHFPCGINNELIEKAEKACYMNKNSSIRTLFNLIKKDIIDSNMGNCLIGICYGDEEGPAIRLKEMVEDDKEIEVSDIVMTRMTSVMAAHTGPGIWGIAVCPAFVSRL